MFKLVLVLGIFSSLFDNIEINHEYLDNQISITINNIETEYNEYQDYLKKEEERKKKEKEKRDKERAKKKEQKNLKENIKRRKRRKQKKKKKKKEMIMNTKKKKKWKMTQIKMEKIMKMIIKKYM
jgi:hypothetical protein